MEKEQLSFLFSSSSRGGITVALLGAPVKRVLANFDVVAYPGHAACKRPYCLRETVFEGMSQKLVPLMITAWITASCIGILMSDSGLVNV